MPRRPAAYPAAFREQIIAVVSTGRTPKELAASDTDVRRILAPCVGAVATVKEDRPTNSEGLRAKMPTW